MTALANPSLRSGPLDHFEHGFNRIAVSAQRRFVATGDVDMNVVVRVGENVVFDKNFGSPNDKIRPTERIRGLAFSADGQYLFVAAGSLVHAFRTTGWQTAWTYEAPRSFGFLIISPICLDVAESGRVAAGFDNGSMVVWDSDGRNQTIVKDNDSPRWMRFVSNGDKLVGSDSFTISSWDLQHRKRKVKMKTGERIFAFDSDQSGRILAVRTLASVEIWELHTRELLSRKGVGPSIPVLAMHPVKPLVAYSERNQVSLADLEGNVLEKFSLAATSALSMCFSPAGDELLIGCTEQTLARRLI